MNKKVLVLLTADYPFGTGEAFLENELPFLSEAFDEIHILSRSGSNNYIRPIPAQTYITEIHCIPGGPGTNFKALLLAANSVFIQELRNLRSINIKRSKTIYKVALKSLLNAHAIKKFLEEYIKKNAIETQVFLYSYWTDDAALAIMLYKRKHRDTIIFSRMHRWDLYFENHPARYLPFRISMLDGLNAIFVISEHGIHYLNEKFGKDKCRKLILSRLGTINDTTNQITSDNSCLRLFSCSSMIPRKRVKLIIDALSMVENVLIRWDHIGNGEQEAALLQYSEAIISRKKNIEYHFHGWQSNKQIKEFYHSQPIDLFINVSSDEGVPVSIMEAFSFGIPAIATAVGGNSEIVKNEHSGYLIVPDPSPDIVADTLLKYFYLTSEEKERYKTNAYNTWNTKYNAEKNYPEFIKLIFSIGDQIRNI